MKKSAIIVLIYASLILVGGMIGYAHAHSNASLIAGVTSSILLILSAYAMLKDYYPGYISSLLITASLVAFFFYRFSLSYKFMPSGMMCVISIAVLGTLAYAGFSAKKGSELQNKP